MDCINLASCKIRNELFGSKMLSESLDEFIECLFFKKEFFPCSHLFSMLVRLLASCKANRLCLSIFTMDSNVQTLQEYQVR